MILAFNVLSTPLRVARRPTAAFSTFGFALVLGASVWATAAAAQRDASPAEQTAKIDRERVMRDIAGAEQTKSTSVHRFSKSAVAPMQRVPVPIFLPPGSLDDYLDSDSKNAVSVRRDVGASKAVGEPGSLFVPTPNGYTVSRSFDRFDLVVRGTNKQFATGDAAEKAAETPGADYINDYSENEDGGVITFGYAGAHYSATFECKAGGFKCLTSAEAKQLVDELLLCGFDDRCVARGPDYIRWQ